MPSLFKSFGAKEVGTTATTLYTAPAQTETTIIGLSVANVSGSDITCDITLTKGAIEYFILKNGKVPVGTSLVAVGGEQKIVVEAGNIVKIKTSSANGADAIMSVLEKS